MIPKRTHNRGLIKMIIVIFIALLLLAYFGLNVRSIVASQTFQDNWNFLSGAAVTIWNNVLKGPLTFIWNMILAPLLSKTTTELEHQAATSTLPGMM